MFEFSERERTVRENSFNRGVQNTADRLGTTLFGSFLRTWRGFEVIEEFPAEGGEADIFVICRNGERFVLKLYRKGLEPKEIVLSKIKELSEKLSEHVIRIYEYGFDGDLGRWYELQEFAPHGNLKRYLASRQIGHEEIKAILHEMNEGLHALHSAGIVHRDIKPSNVLLRSSDPLDLVFTDFGISSVIDSDVSKKLTTVKGTPIYCAPEVFTGVMGKEVDYWSLGMIIYEALTGRNPLSGLSVHTITFKLTTEGIQIPDVDERYKVLLSGLLARNPKERWGYEQVKAWIEGKPVSAPKVAPKKIENRAEAYKFMDRYFNDLESLTLAFIENAESFDLAKRHIMKGYLRNWLEKQGDFDNLARLDDAIENSKFAEEAVVRFVYSYHDTVPLTLYGKEITTDYLIELLIAAQTRSLLPDDEKIYELIQKTHLSKIIQAYEHYQGSISSELKTLTKNAEAAAKHGKLESFAGYIAFLKANQISFQQPTALDPFHPEFEHETVLDEQFLSVLYRFSFNGGIWFDGKRLTAELIQTELGKTFKRLLDTDGGSTDLFDLAEDPYVQLLMERKILELIETKDSQLSKALQLYAWSLRNVLEALSNIELRSKFIAHSMAREFSKLGFKPNIAVVLTESISKEFISRLENHGIKVEKSSKLPALVKAHDLVGVFVNGQSNVFSTTTNLVFLTDDMNRALEEHYHYISIDESNFECASLYIAYLLRALSVGNFIKRVVEETLREERDLAKRLLRETMDLREELADDALGKIKEATLKEISEGLLSEEISTKDIEGSLGDILEHTFRELEREVKEAHRRNSRRAIETFLRLSGNEEKLNQLNSAYDSTHNAKRCASSVGSLVITLLLSPEVQRELSLDTYERKAKRGSCLLSVLGTLFILGGCVSLFDYATFDEVGGFMVIGLIMLVGGIVRQSTARKRAESIRERNLHKIIRRVGRIFDNESYRLRKLILEELERYVSHVANVAERLDSIVEPLNF